LEGGLYSLVERTLTALPVVQAYGGERRALDRFRAETGAVLAATVATTRVQLRFKVLMGLATAGGTAAIFWLGAQHALEGRLSVGSILIFLSYLAALYSPLESVMYLASTVQGAAGSARRVREVLDTPAGVRDPAVAAPLPRLRGRVRLERVTFSYEPGRPALRDVSLDIPAGQTVALVGRSGAGKTTLASLIPRFFDPEQGRVLVDERDVRGVSVRALRRQVALVLQEPFLLPLTVAQNIAYARPGASRAQIVAAARAAHADEFIARLPAGYDTVLGERGATLSGGQRQRLAIARAFLQNAPILILDEPTSALDAESERLVLASLRRLMAGRTTLIIAHRLSTVRDAARVVVLDAGRIVEDGTHAGLLAQGGLYARAYRLQFGLQDGAPATDLAGAGA
jgi:ATP-binding cassette, subfamily B, bacterial